MVVVLADGDLTAAEAESEMKAQDEGPPPPETKIMFKKPTKRTSKDNTSSSEDVSKPKKSISGRKLF